MTMLSRSLAVWLGILVLASVNGALRDLVLAPRLGDTPARALSTVILCGLVLLVTWWSVAWIGPRSRSDAITIGVLWVVCTLGFEFLAGHYLFRKAWAELLADYDLRRGRIWIAALVVTFAAPWWMARARGLERTWSR
ncbi:MAG: hypothetical protein ACJ8DJ_13190 [Gemmatimonadales bacterium]